ncbi:MAG: glutamine-synthetase adenylyltransferase [Paracoccaceae bacterium]
MTRPTIAAQITGMDIVSQITTTPRAFDEAAGDDMRVLFADVPDAMRDVLVGAGGSSPYLRALMLREDAWLRHALLDPEIALQELLGDMTQAEPTQIATTLRQGKRRIALLSGVLDLGGIWSLEQVTGALSTFAARACDAALKAALKPLIARGKLPGITLKDLTDAGGMFVLAMGKMGADELNYSSDIDLICLFDQDRFTREDFTSARTTFVKATRAMAKTLSDVTGEGYVFRTDLRLRPDPSVTPVCMAMTAAETYYESLGRTWERAAYIKAKPVAGDLKAGQAFLDTLSPFVWRKHLDFAAIEDAHNMRLAIRAHKKLPQQISLPDHNMKLGRGGIREIEFFTQTRQLIAGGRDPDLRVRGTVEGLTRLAAAGWIDADVAAKLSDHYRFHRTVEHRLQMVQDAQTHNLPKSDAEFDRLACLMGRDTDDLKSELMDRLGDVHTTIERFFAPDPSTPDHGASDLLSDTHVARWLSYPALRSPRARSILDRLRGELDSRLRAATRPDEALSAFEGFLSGLPAGVQVLSLFEANPSLIDLVLDVITTSPALAEYLSRHAHVLDAVIGGGFFAPWPGADALEQDLCTQLDPIAPDYEAVLDTARRWMKEHHFRIGVHVLRHLISADEAGAQYSDLAHAILRGLWPHVCTEFARKHGPAPGRGAAIIGMGALGAGRMNAGSDLDLIVIYDAPGIEGSDGPRPLATRPYFARLTKALITALSAPLSEGRLYEVDMRLRPSGNKGPVATSLTAFKDYQSTEAWTWEHLALTRARCIAGPAALTAEIETFRCDILARSRVAATIASDVQDMRRRISAAKQTTDLWNPKTGAGHLQDIDLAVQMGALLSGQAHHNVQSGAASLDTLLADHRRGGSLVESLTQAHALMWQMQIALRLVSTAPLSRDTMSLRTQQFLTKATEQTSLDALEQTLVTLQARAAKDIDVVLEQLQRAHGHG